MAIYGVNGFPWKLVLAADDEAYKAVENFIDETKSGKPESEISPVEFLDPEREGVLYLLSHGAVSGNFYFNGVLIDTVTYLRQNYDRLHAMGVKKVLSICCHGGLQKKVSYKGIIMSSTHISPFKIYVEANPIALMPHPGVVVSMMLPGQKHVWLKSVAMKVWAVIFNGATIKELK